MGRWAVGVFAGLLASGCASNGTSPPGGGSSGQGDGGGSGSSDAGADSAGPSGPNNDDGGGAADTGPGTVPEDAAPIVLADGATDTIGPYGANGSVAYTTSTFSVPAPNGTFTTTAYIPSGTSPMPVVILSSGLQQPGAAYAPYAERLASWGIVTLLRDDPGVFGEASPGIAQDVEYEISTWLAAQNTTSSSALAGKVDTTRIGLAGHSRGGQVSILAAAGSQGLIKGMFGLDPVDSSADGGVGEAASVIGSVGVPLAFIGETTDSASNSCAPAANNYEVLYAAASSPIVAITAINADHTMFELSSECVLCSFCTAGTASQAQVIAYAERYLMAFFARQLLGDTSVGAAFEGAGATQDVTAGLVSLQSK